jgi:hypothetical protein
MGNYKLRWLKNDKNPIAKNPYFNSRKEKIVKNQCGMGLMW